MTDETTPARWEYHAEFISAETDQCEDFLRGRWPDAKFETYAPEVALPRLNELGGDGWELIEMRPVAVGGRGDVLVSTGASEGWARAYLCTFKRRLAGF